MNVPGDSFNRHNILPCMTEIMQLPQPAAATFAKLLQQQQAAAAVGLA
jgi:hypothetical protein